MGALLPPPPPPPPAGARRRPTVPQPLALRSFALNERRLARLAAAAADRAAADAAARTYHPRPLRHSTGWAPTLPSAVAAAAAVPSTAAAASNIGGGGAGATVTPPGGPPPPAVVLYSDVRAVERAEWEAARRAREATAAAEAAAAAAAAAEREAADVAALRPEMVYVPVPLPTSLPPSRGVVQKKAPTVPRTPAFAVKRRAKVARAAAAAAATSAGGETADETTAAPDDGAARNAAAAMADAAAEEDAAVAVQASALLGLRLKEEAGAEGEAVASAAPLVVNAMAIDEAAVTSGAASEPKTAAGKNVAANPLGSLATGSTAEEVADAAT